MKISNWRIVALGGLTLLLFPLLAFFLYWIVEGEYVSFLDIFKSETHIVWEIIIGSIIGCGLGVLAWSFVRSKYMRPVLVKYGNVVKSLRLKVGTILFLSFCAGAGEEIFFRGVLQDYLGVIITAIIFVLIHGYLNPFDKTIMGYGILMTLIIIGIGYLDKHVGLITAMSAHMWIDVVLFYKLTNTDLIHSAITSKSDVVIFGNSQE